MSDFLDTYAELDELNEDQLPSQLPDWAVTGNKDGFLGVWLFDMLFGIKVGADKTSRVNDHHGSWPSWMTELKKIFEERGIDFKTADSINFVATDSSGENIILAFRAYPPTRSMWFRFEATSRMKINQLNPVWEYNAGINGKYSFHRERYKPIDINTYDAKVLADTIKSYYDKYLHHLENEKIFKERYIGKKLVSSGKIITEDDIAFCHGNNGAEFPHFSIKGLGSWPTPEYWWNENDHNWYMTLNRQYKVKRIEESEIIE